MSAANCPETGRQKMIGMMYLFLTAMLAINVSKSILDAFVVVNDSLEVTNATFESKNDIMYTQLEAARANDPKAIPFYEASKEVQKLANEMVAYILDLRGGVLNEAEPIISVEDGKTIDLSKVMAKDDYDTPTRYFVGLTEDAANGKARELKEKLAAYRDALINIMKNDNIKLHDKVGIIEGLGNLGLNTSDPTELDPDHPEKNRWETAKFFHMPLAAAITILSQMENQVKNAEATILSKLLGGIGSLDFKFDTLAAKVIPKSNYVISGGQYEADLFVAAFSTSANPTVFIGEGFDSATGKLTGKVDSIPVENGMGKLKLPANSIGLKKYAALIKIKNSSTGEIKQYPLKLDGNFYAEYIVAKPSATISPTKMNVLYIGVPNPIDISVSGFPDSRVSASVRGGRLSKKAAGKYIATVTKPGKTKISVNVKDDNGKSRSMGSMEFRVKYIPKPEAKIAGKNGGTIKKSELMAQQGVKADLENFAFDLKFRVTGFTVVATIDGYERAEPGNSYRFSAKQKNLMKKVRRGSRVSFTNIKAKGPDGRNKKLSSIIFKLK